MSKNKVLWWLGLVIAVLSCIIGYCSCTAGITIGKANRVEQTVTNIADSTSATFSILPNSK